MQEQKIIFNNLKGDKLSALLRNPTGDNNKLMMILCHGLCSNKNTNTFTELVPKLASRNISTFRFDFWGHGESDGSFKNVTVTEAVDDVLQAISYIKSLGYTRIGLLGSSFGGNAAIMAAVKISVLQILCLKSPVSNYQDIWNNEVRENWKKQGYRYYKDKDDHELKLNYAFYEDALKYNGYEVVADIPSKVYVVHGDRDETVPIAQSIKFTALVHGELATIKGADHVYSNPLHHNQMVDQLADFVIAAA